MDWVRLHLLVNHFPIILGVTATLAAIAAALSRRHALWRYAYTTALLAGLTAPVAYFSGLQAEETVEGFWFVEETHIEEHEALGLYALLGLLVAAIAAGAAWRRSGPASRGAFLATTVAASLLTGLAALEGGEIIHDSPVLTDEPPAGVGVPATADADGAPAAMR